MFRVYDYHSNRFIKYKIQNFPSSTEKVGLITKVSLLTKWSLWCDRLVRF